MMWSSQKPTNVVLEETTDDVLLVRGMVLEEAMLRRYSSRALTSSM